MYCPYCGNKVEDDAKFCGECGASMEGLGMEEIQDLENETLSEEQEETIEEEVEEKMKKAKKPIKKEFSKSEQKKIKIIIGEAIVFAVILISFIVVGSSYSSPEKIMEKYAQERQEGDWEEIYELYDIADNGFVTKDQFVSFMQKKEQTNGLVTNYAINPTSINNGITQTMVMTYSTSAGGTGLQEYFTVKRDASKRFIFFQKWSLDDENIFQKNLYIKYIPGVTMELDGVEIKKEYLETYTNGDYKVQAYKIPVVLTGEHVLSFKDDDGFIEETDQTISVSYEGQYCVPSVKYTQEAAKKAVASAKTYVKEIYDAAYGKKGVSAIKKYFSDADEAKEAYDEIVESYHYYTENNYSMKGYSIKVNSAEANTNAEEAGLRVMVYGTINIDYQYRGIYSGSVYKYNTDRGIYQSMVIGYEDGEWKIASFGY